MTELPVGKSRGFEMPHNTYKYLLGYERPKGVSEVKIFYWACFQLTHSVVVYWKAVWAILK
jgi:hypothetical protein